MSNGPAAEHRWQRVKQLMHAALELEPPARGPYLREECADDELRHEVESLLAAHEEAGDFLEAGPDSALFAGMFSPGDRVGAYRIKRLVGEGGMGMVYEAVRADGEFRRRVAVKVVSEGVADFAIKRFRAERQILADIDHPFIARLLDGGTTGDGAPYLVMEFIDGEPIDRYCDSRQLDLRQRLALFRDVCDAVRYAHQHQVVHRDLKPGNVIVTEDGMPKLLDFGVAKLLDSARDDDTREPRRGGQVPMTPSFASPEQLVGDRTTPSSDVYSLGVLLYLLVCGRRPYELAGLSWENVIATVCEGVVTPPSLVFTPDGTDQATAFLSTDAPTAPAADVDGEGDRLAAILAARRSDTGSLAATLQGDLDAIIMRALAKSPHDRYADAGELGTALSEYLVETDPAYADRRKTLTRRQRLALAAVVVAGVALVGAGVMQLLGPPVRTVSIVTQFPLVTWPSEEFDGHVSPDGRWVSFISGDRRRELWIRPVDSEDLTLVATESSGLLGHVWSPRSSHLAYLVMTLEGAVLRVSTREGVLEGVIPLSAQRPGLVRWIGDHMYFTDAGALWRMDMKSREVERLTDPGVSGTYRSVDVNQREDAIVYTTEDGDGQSDLWVADLSGANARRVTRDATRETNARWYGDEGDIICLSDEGGMVDVWLITEGHRERVTTSPRRERRLGVSGDGSLLLVDTAEEDADVWRLSGDGNAQPLTDDDLPDYFPSLATATGKVAFQRVRPSPAQGLGPFDADIYVFDPASGEPPARRVAGAFAPALSPDGAWLAYVVRSQPTPAPFSLRVQGSDDDFLITSTLSAPEYFGFPMEWDSLNVAWGPESGLLYFVESGADGVQRLMQTDIRGRAEHAISLYEGAAGEKILDMAVSPDESRIAFVALPQREATESGIYLWERSRGTVRTLEEATPGQSYLAGWVDNGSLVVAHGEPMPSGGRATNAFILRVEGDERRDLGTIDQAITQTAILDLAGSRLLMTAVNQGVHNVYELGLDGRSTPRPVTSNASASVSFSGLSVADNGDLMYVRQEVNSNVWLIKLTTSSRYSNRKGQESQ